MSLLLRRPPSVDADGAPVTAPSSVLALQYVEIDVDYCALRYGATNAAGTCPAQLGQDSAAKCFNTVKTCAVPASFLNAPVTLRFASPTDDLPADIDCVPAIKSIQFDPGMISLGENLGQRSALTITFYDHPSTDTGPGGDPYLTDRGYNPFVRGSFFGKFRARQPYLFGRSIRWINGVLGQTLEQMETRHFIIDSFSGPTPAGEYTIVAKDILKLADGDKSLAPLASEGFLLADITDVATAAVLSPTGIGSTYPTSGYAAIAGSEICAFTRSGDNLTLTRAQLGTEAQAHNAQDRVQLVLRYVGLDPAVIIADLLGAYAGIDSSNIPLAAWQAETGAYLNRVYTAVIAQPESVATLVSELIQQAGLSLWWNDRDQTIGLRVLRGAIVDAQRFSEDNYIASSLDITEQPDTRLSQVHVYFAQINSLTSLTDKSNYRSVSITRDAAAEANYGSAAIKEIFSRWISALGRSVADRLGEILLGRFRDPPRHFKFSFLRYSIAEVLLAGSYRIASQAIQDPSGVPVDADIQVTRLSPPADVIVIEADETLFSATLVEDTNVRALIVDSNINNINLRSAHDALYAAPVAGVTVNCTVNAGITVGSTSVSTPAFDIGSWPSGVTINLIVNGRIQGAGGNGGDGGNNAGQAGGTALYTRLAIDLLVSAGAIFGGGGGGGGGGGTKAGGGGAGTLPGSGGSGNVNGAAGTSESGGLGGGSPTNPHGGNGGGPGLAGSPGTVATGGSLGSGGAAGAAIDGNSFVTVTLGPGDIRGGRIN